MDRPLLLATFALALLLAAAESAGAQTVKAVKIAGGFVTPTSLTSPPGDASRLFVTTEGGGIVLIDHGIVQSELFLDLSGEVAQDFEGLLSLAFHPDYAQNGRFYVVFQDTAHDSRLVEYRVSDDPDRADPTSATLILGPVPQPHIVHNWNALAFGPDGMLYLGTGDGGPANDPNDEAQSRSSLLGKILRLDVDRPPPHVPPDNPFVGKPGAAEEIWAFGLRQPWRIAFDRLTGDIYIGEVGQGAGEEIDFQPAGSSGGENYGWRCMEGTNCTQTGSCACNDPSWVLPIHEYPHTGGNCCIIGGYVYRGSAMPWLQGSYFFGDFCSGRVWTFRYDGAALSDFVERTEELRPCDGSQVQLITSFGEDADGELYVLDNLGGEIFKLVPGDGTAYRYCPIVPNSAGPGATIGYQGSTSVGANDLVLTAAGAVPAQSGIFYFGRNPGQIPFGDGFRCVTGTTWRLLPPLQIGPNGAATRPLDLANPPAPGAQILPGDVVSFQFWFRDAQGPGGSGFNLSDALRVAFCP